MWISNMPTELIGKTIVGVGPASSESGWTDNSGFTLHFSDGSSAVMTPTGYEADGIRIELDSYVGRMRRGAIAAGYREQRRVERLAGEVRRRENEALRKRMKAELPPEAFEQWERERDPLYVLKSVWGDEMRRQLYADAPLLRILD